MTGIDDDDDMSHLLGTRDDGEQEPEALETVPEVETEAEPVSEDAAEEEGAFDEEGEEEEGASKEPKEPPPELQYQNDQNVTLPAGLMERISESLDMIALKLPNMTLADMERNQERLEVGENGLTDITEDEFEFAAAMDESMSFQMPTSVETDALRREGADFKQVIEGEGGKVGFSVRRPAMSGGDKLTGDDARYHMRSAMGMSRPAIVPCFNTGITIEFHPPKLGALITLMQKIMAEKDQVGRRSKAVMMSNNTVFMREALVDFALRHVSKTNYEDRSAEGLKKVISVLDWPSIIHGVASSLWTRKYELQVPCMNHAFQCRHLNRFSLTLNRMVVTDDSRLSDYQRKMITNTRKPVTEEMVNAYKADHLNGEPERRHLLADNEASRTFVVFKQPTLAEHIDQGKHWVDGISKTVIDELESASAKTVDEMMNTLSAATAGREHCHWVARFEIQREDGSISIIDNYDDIMSSLEDMTEDGDVFERFTTGLSKFISDSTLTVIGVARSRCEKCQQTIVGDESAKDPLRFVGAYDSNYMIPIDVETTFFTLAQSKVFSET